ncbi:MAG: protein kinase [Planctomycetota bacterium]
MGGVKEEAKGQEVPPAAASPHTARLSEIGGFEILEKIGQGGMGAVFKARQKSLDRVVALKVLPPSVAKNTLFIERFQREARASARFNHPHIVQGIDVGKDPPTGLWYFAMEYVDGPSLKQVLAQQKIMPEARALALVRQVAQALECIAANGMVHRDIKPDNILLTKHGEAKLADLGLAKQAHDDASITQSGTSVGTPHYMSPEQVRGLAHEIDIRSDLYALGATLFHLVTGRAPYTGESSVVIMSKHLTEPPPNARAANPQVSESCSRLIEWLMQKKKEQRVQTPAELLEQLDKLQRQQPLAGPPRAPSAPLPASVGAPRSRLWLVASVAALLALAVGGLYVIMAKKPRDSAAQLTAAKDSTVPAQGESTAPVRKAEPAVLPKAAAKADAPPAKALQKKEGPQELFHAAQEWEKAHPEACDEILARYRAVAQAAKNAAPDPHFSELLEDAIEAVEARRGAAAETAWKALEQKINTAAAAGDYDAALLLCGAAPLQAGKSLEERAAAKAKALHHEAEEKIKSAVARIEECSANVEPADGLKLLAAVEKGAYAPTKGLIETLKKRLQDELANEGELKHKKALRTAEIRLAELQQRFDLALLEAGSLQAAKQVAAEAARDPALAPLEAQARALGALCTAFDELARMSQEALAKLKGQKVELETKSRKISGLVEKIQDGVVHLRIVEAGMEAKPEVKISDLNDEQRKVFSGTVAPQTNAQRLAVAVAKLAKGKEDLRAAAALLPGAGDFPLVPHYGGLLERLQQKAAQAEAEAKAEAAWAELDFRSSMSKLSEAEAKTLLGKVARFEKEFSATQLAASVRDKLAAMKERARLAGGANVVKNGSFGSGVLEPWQTIGGEACRCEVVKSEANGGKFAASLRVSGRGGLEQAVVLDPGVAYKFSARVKPVKGNAALCRLRVSLSDGDKRAEIGVAALASMEPDAWNQVEGLAHSSGAKATLYIMTKCPIGTELLIDDVQLLKVDAAPAPDAAPKPTR